MNSRIKKRGIVGQGEHREMYEGKVWNRDEHSGGM